jgi:hypothetical protein
MAIKTAGKTFCDLKIESAATQTSKTSASPSEENNNASKTTSRNTRP